MTRKLEDNYNCRDPPPGKRGPGPVSGSLAWRSCTEKRPFKLWLWRPQASLLARGLWEIETPLLKGTHKISHSGTQGRSSNLKRAWLFTMTYRRKNLYIIHKHTCIYTQAWKQKFCETICPALLFSILCYSVKKTNAVNCPVHWFLNPLMSPPEVWKTHIWFSKPSYILSSQWLRQEGEDCSTN